MENIHRSIWEIEEEITAIHQTIVQKIYLSLTSSKLNKKPHSLMSIFNSVLNLHGSLAGKNRRFRYNNALEGKRSFNELFSYITRLVDLGLVYKIPLRGQLSIDPKKNMFKLLPTDPGLFASANGISLSSLADADEEIIYEIFFVKEFKDLLPKIQTWHENSSTLSFLIETEDQNFIPVDIRNPAKTKSKALDQFIRRYSPKNSFLFTTRTSRENEVDGIALQKISDIRTTLREYLHQ